MTIKLVKDTLAKVDSIQGSDKAKTASTALTATGNILKVGEELETQNVLFEAVE